jgi:hypothetical protein
MPSMWAVTLARLSFSIVWMPIAFITSPPGELMRKVIARGEPRAFRRALKALAVSPCLVSGTRSMGSKKVSSGKYKNLCMPKVKLIYRSRRLLRSVRFVANTSSMDSIFCGPLGTR